MHRCRLSPHPSTPCRDVAGIAVRLAWQPDALILTYTLSGAIARLLIPAPATPARADGLWRHTCFEVFVMAGAGPAYREFNFAPSGAWAAYAFTGYRDGGPLVPAPAPAIVCRAGDDVFALEAHLPRSALPEATNLRLGLSAVVEGRDGTLSYWALRHPPGVTDGQAKPDFHHTDAFALTLTAMAISHPAL